METSSKVVFALNHLIDVNGERVNLYKELADKSKDQDLKFLFLEYAIQAQTFTATLNKWRHAYGFLPYSGRKADFVGTAIRQIKRAFSFGGRASTLKECESLENNALKKYRTAVALSFLPTAAIADIEKQADQLEKAFYSLVAHRESDDHQVQTSFV